MSEELNWSFGKDKIAVASFVLGIISFFLWELSIFPLSATVLGVAGIVRTRKGQDGLWMAIVGAALGVLFLFVRLNH